jgi:hypothetical protein
MSNIALLGGGKGGERASVKPSKGAREAADGDDDDSDRNAP